MLVLLLGCLSKQEYCLSLNSPIMEDSLLGVVSVPNQQCRQKLFLKPLLVILLLSSLIACDQGKKEASPLIVGVVNSNPGHLPIVEAFKTRFQAISDKDNQPIIWLEHSEAGMEQIDFVLDSMAAQHVDLIFSTGSHLTKKVTTRFEQTDVSVVFAPSFDPVRLGVVDRLHHGDKRVTGVKVGGSSAKALEYLLMAQPTIKKILVPHSGLSRVETYSLADLKVAARKLSVQLVILPVDNESGLKSALENIADDVDALWLLHSKYLVPQVDTYVAAAIKNSLPLASGTGQGANGVMISYGRNAQKVGYQAARLADQVSHGVLPQDLPIEVADFFLSINLKVAAKAGVEIPSVLLHQADNVYIE